MIKHPRLHKLLTGFVLGCMIALVGSSPSAGMIGDDSPGRDILRGPQEGGPQADLATARPARGERPHHPERILVKPRKGVSLAALDAVHARHGAKVARSFRSIGNLQVLRLPKGGRVDDFLDGYRRSGLVEYAEPDYEVQALETHPDDPRYLDGSLWGLNNVGQNGGTADADIDAPEGWDALHDAAGVIVAVIDTGVRYTHEDLAANMWVNPGEIPGNKTDDDGNGYVDDVHGINAISGSGSPLDDHGHGTHVAGTIGAIGNNGTGVVGVAWQGRIMACKFLGSNGAGFVSDAIECIDYARRMGAQIMNNSWGGEFFSQALANAVESARDGGVIFVAAAGNSAVNADVYPMYPAALDPDNVVSVAASDNRDTLAWFSNYGPKSVDLAAPGVDIVSTWGANDAAYATAQGTSMAAPHVSGVLALLASKYPAQTYPQLIVRLLEGTDRLPSLEGTCRTGGRLNLDGALNLTFPDLYVSPSDELQFRGRPGGPFGGPRVYRLANFGTAPLEWSASTAGGWLDLSPASGVLSPGESAVIAASVNDSALDLPVGTYAGTITFSNTAGSVSTERRVKLYVGRVYVNRNALGPVYDGASWATAFPTIRAGISAASPGQEIWVAAGTYAESIMLKPGVALYGGFAGNETEMGQRNSAARLTILDGEGRRRIVLVPPGSDPTTVIDGFVLVHGEASSGSAVYCDASSPTISNNLIKGGSALGDWSALGGGGGIFCKGGAPIIVRNTISENSAYDAGGAIYCYNSSAFISGNTITGNLAYRGDGVYCRGGSPVVANNVIMANSARGYGGGIYCLFTSAGVVNNTIAGNSAVHDGGGIYVLGGAPVISNNIIAFNSSGIGNTSGGAPTLSHNCIYGNEGYDFNGLAGNPIGSNGNISVDPRLANRDYGDVHIQPNSPCVGAGDQSAVPPGWFDIDGQARIQGARVDIGADESDGTLWQAVRRIVRVSTEGDDANDGASWSAAKRTVQAGINALSPHGGEVWVKAGTYQEHIVLAPYVYVYGGFAGVETDRSQRNWRTNATVLDGGGSGSVVTARSGHVFGAVDGFTIANGGGTLLDLLIGRGYYGGGILCESASPSIRNNVIRDNHSMFGGAIYCGSSSPDISNNTIKGNSALSGGGVSCDWSHPLIANNVIIGNGAAGGAGIYCLQSLPMIVNNTITGNSAALYGGMYLLGSSPRLSNNIVAFNSSGISAIADSSRPVLTNNCVYGNTRYDYDGFSSDPTGTNGNISQDPGLAGPEYGNVHIQPDSPCRDAGDDTVVQKGSLDMDGEPRVRKAHVDIGADESYGALYPSGPYAVIRVSPEGDDGSDGSSWESAKRTVQAGIDAASQLGGEVWVRAGTYPERIILRPYAYVYGGFAGGEEERSQRNWTANQTVLDGQGGGTVVTALAGHRVSAIDGFTVRNGNAFMGGGISCPYSSPIIEHNTVTGNDAWFGGGVYFDYSSPAMSSNIITANTGTFGGGIGLSYYSWASIRNNVITGNNALEGGGVYLYDSPLAFSNNIVAFNSSGIFKDFEGGYGIPPTLLGNDVYGNASYEYHGFEYAPTGSWGNFSADPMFIDLAGGDCRLSLDSPCLESGTPGGLSADMDGNPRPVDWDCDGRAIPDVGAYERQHIWVNIDVLPGDESNVVYLPAKGLINVAILGRVGFDVRSIDPMSVALGPGKAREVHGKGHWGDIDGDGARDLLLHFALKSVGIAPEDTTLSLCGRLTTGETITGTDILTVVTR